MRQNPPTGRCRLGENSCHPSEETGTTIVEHAATASVSRAYVPVAVAALLRPPALTGRKLSIVE